MRLLVSVRNAVEAEAALAGGADIIDAKEPLNGALGPVAPEVIRSIAAKVAGSAPVSVALGDVGIDDIAEGLVTATRAGAAFVKVGFAGRHRVAAHLTISNLIGHAGLIAVAYADYLSADAPSPDDIIELGRRMKAQGILLDTCDKTGPGLPALMSLPSLCSFVARARSCGQVVALAGKLTADDIDLVCEAGADIVGVRSAACDGGRSGVVTATRVRMLRMSLDRWRQRRPVLTSRRGHVH